MLSRRSVRTLALIGNPNTGKTTLFNALTGLAQHAGNYPGVTVEYKVGTLTLDGGDALELIDLPGAYSLAAHSPDEMLAIDVLLGQQQDAPPIDGILAVVDASNLRRNFYLVSQLAEIGLPLVVALNMGDIAIRRGIRIDARALSEALGAPVVPICAHRRQGLDELRRTLADLSVDPAPTRPQQVALPDQLQRATAELQAAVPGPLSSAEALRALVDEDGYAERRLLAASASSAESSASDGVADRLHDLRMAGADALSELESNARYAWIDGLLAQAIDQPSRLEGRRSDRADRILAHRLFGVAIFVLVNVLVFEAIYTWSGPLMDGIDALFAACGDRAAAFIPPGALQSLVVDGLIAGVGGVLIFLPQIAILFFFIALLEDSGYMARAALLMDRLLTRVGLSGTAFMPLLSSFACAVPGIMATRTIEDRRDRFATILVAPLMSCSARLPVYVLFIGAFVPDSPLLGGVIGLQALTLLAFYCLGALVAIPVAWLLKRTLLKGDPPPFLLELPSYKTPDPRTVLLRVYHSSRAFVVRAGSLILATTIAMWALAYFPRSGDVVERHQVERQAVAPAALDALEKRQAAELVENSYLGQAGHWVAPAVRPLGWDWRIGMAVIASFPAREVIISALGTIYSLGAGEDEGSETLRTTLAAATWPDGRPIYTLPVALSIMVFFALCAQCLSTLVVIKKETGSYGWSLFSFGYMTAFAYLGALATYQVGTALGF
ncbi:MAG: ferrous iron transport protein B [Gemmatimonadetes bacterium]|nr:ferrous iron transport protein B [Gemmatimonadota bacterium]MXY83616.1 ferrous iron transport protein B [Gemmatimonadota bacterium]MYB69949.1 ferrous iron transport protein B [Gemmatimonadota bacterium]